MNSQELITSDELYLKDIKQAISKKKDSLLELYQLYRYNFEINNDTLMKNKFKAKIDELDFFKTQINKREMDAEFNFIDKNLSSFISADLLLNRLKKREGLYLYDTINSKYNKLAKLVKNTTSGKLLNQALNDYRDSKINSIAPNFILSDINNEKIELSSFKNNKYILIDFWASWCVPCREEFGFLKEIYSKYKSYGFEIIIISRDEDIESWKKAIVKDNINAWKHISTKLNNSDIESKYFINAIPSKVLIDKEGKIIGRWRGGEEENKKELLSLLNQVFNN